MARTLFFRMVLRKFSEITNNKQFLVGTIFFTIMNIAFFNLRFDLFLIIAKVVNHIRNNVVCVVRSFTAHISRLYYFMWLCSNKDVEYWLSYNRITLNTGRLKTITPSFWARNPKLGNVPFGEFFRQTTRESFKSASWDH